MQADAHKEHHCGDDGHIGDAAGMVGAVKDLQVQKRRPERIDYCGEEYAAVDALPGPCCTEKEDARADCEHDVLHEIKDAEIEIGKLRDRKRSKLPCHDHEHIKIDPPQQKHASIEKIQIQLALILAIVRPQSQRRHERNHMQEKHDVGHGRFRAENFGQDLVP